MPQSASAEKAPANASASAPASVPASPLMAFILAAVASMMAPTLAGQHLARLAAQEAIDAYRTHGQHELVTIGQIVAFAVTALDTLRLSMPEDVPLPMKLRLRGNANGLNRASRDCTRLLETARLPANGGATTPSPAAVEKTHPTAATGQKTTPLPPPATACLTGIDWADAMKSVAATLQAGANSVSPDQRATDALWIEALNGVGGELMQQATASSGRSLLSPSGTSPPTRPDIPVPPGPVVPPGSRHASPGNRPPARHRAAQLG